MSERNVDSIKRRREMSDLRQELRRLVEAWKKRREQVVFCIREEQSRADTYEVCVDDIVAVLQRSAAAELTRMAQKDGVRPYGGDEQTEHLERIGKERAVIEAARTYKAEWDGDSKDRDYTLGIARGRLFDCLEELEDAGLRREE